MVTTEKKIEYPTQAIELSNMGWKQLTYEPSGYQTWLNPNNIPVNIKFNRQGLVDMYISTQAMLA
jgi:hypothetical protein